MKQYNVFSDYNTDKIRVWLRYCKRCKKIFRTIYRNGDYCFDCYSDLYKSNRRIETINRMVNKSKGLYINKSLINIK